MAIFGYTVLNIFAVILTILVLFAVLYGGEEFSFAGIIPAIMGVLFVVVMWCTLFTYSPF